MNNIQSLWPDQKKAMSQWSDGILHHAQLAKDKWWGKDFPKNEEFWKYVKFNELGKTNWQLPKPSNESNQIKYDSGKVLITLSDFSINADWKEIGKKPKGIEILSLLKVFEEIKRYQKYLEPNEKENFFESLNMSFLSGGIFIRITGTESVIPIEVFVNCTEKKTFINPKIIVVAEKNSRSQIAFKTSSSERCFLNISKSFHLSENSQMKIYCKEQGHSESHIIGHDNLYLEKSSQCHFYDMTLPSNWTRHNVTSHLLGEGAEIQLIGSYINDKEHFSDHHTIINHHKPHTQSRQNYKGILADKAKAVFNGRVYVAPGAEKSNSEQLNKNLLLSEKAEVNTKPELQIYNDDVKAAHGATVGQLDKEQLFYLQSRGIKREQAWRLLSEAFIYDLFEDLSELEKSFFVNSIEETLGSMKGVDGGV